MATCSAFQSHRRFPHSFGLDRKELSLKGTSNCHSKDQRKVDIANSPEVEIICCRCGYYAVSSMITNAASALTSMSRSPLQPSQFGIMFDDGKLCHDEILSYRLAPISGEWNNKAKLFQESFGCFLKQRKEVMQPSFDGYLA